MTSRFIAAAALLLALSSVAHASPDEIISCPDDIRAGVFTTLRPEWVATPQSSRVQQAVVERIGANRVLSCRYRLFGTIYTVYRAWPPRYDYCAALDYPVIGFGCYVPGHR